MIVIVSGRSGSGKSIALRALEDMGFYCVDNIPVNLLPQLIQTLSIQQKMIAISLDIRNLPQNAFTLKEIFKQLDNHEHKPVYLFLDADKQTLIRRYSDTRRLHPLSVNNLSLEEAIDKENDSLTLLRFQADILINTTNLSVHELAEQLREKLLQTKKRELIIIIQSFGYKYGLPLDADYIFDARFLPNPHWEPNLRPLTGLDEPIINYLGSRPEVVDFIYQTFNYLKQWLPALEKNNRSYLTIGIGCTGGQHRSVFIAERLSSYFISRGKQVKVTHREI